MPLRPSTRRDFLLRVSRYGGAAVLGAMFGLELLARDDRFRPRFDGRAGRRRRVVILGGGLAGLCAAYELQRLGYACTVLEARARPGGRCWTVRGGDAETETGNPRQVCAFAPGHHLNAGPMRIPHHHTTTLGYCREFDVPLTTFTNFNEAAYIVRNGRPRMRIREVVADLSGYTSELLAKVVKRGELDLPLSSEDREKFIEYLRAEGRLDTNLVYPRAGDSSATAIHLDHSRGYTNSPGALGGPGEPTQPLDLDALVKGAYGGGLGFMKDFHQQPTMLTVVGGMDRIAYGFAERLKGIIRYRAPVQEIRRTAEGGVRIVHGEAEGGGARELEADFCICALPPNLLRQLPADFSPATRAALQEAIASPAGKIGLQFRRRFWEEDDDIYGGSSKTDDAISQIYYPCENFGVPGRGVIIGYYHFGESRAVFDDQAPAVRERLALEQGARIHPQYPEEFESSFSVAWHRVPHNESAWTWWKDDPTFEAAQKVLRAPDGPFHFAGDWTSNIVGWQAGAFVSAHRACARIHELSRQS